MYHIQNIIAKNLATYRNKHQLSLDKMANLTGVSKNMLSQIEKGASNPTITTLWKIANGLHLPLSQLTSTRQEHINFVDESDIVPIVEDKVKIFPYFPYDDRKHFEMFKMEIQPGGKMISDPHHIQSEEFIIVNSGTLNIEVEQTSYTISSNQAFRFNSDVAHGYYNPNNEVVILTATIHYHVQ
ncbi:MULTISPECIES: helix-turn-helix domain-containing protein [Staphylococcus]|uniref:helix-turn-helix domain-containing protein n=1 Tax=Staphylococcus TaxID=1279 RepID=UPI00092BF46C|nr:MULTISPECIES: XRE family transcriptional regulator [Staphylococcus]MBL0376091.1 helix-turn-helix transcriptional regulator [Staphylococcus sp. S75]MBL0383095.1 helix-turn-helix transcriptional regulator [Staphylococcus sp. S59]MBL0401683.1 helix-turn-helix transcriptional regulator [Staphylococcus sp. S36]RNM26369.1 XRE family transcriptional regulator [Staphylococcus cohnii]MDU9371717.1 XRE family transcriptional regulator [Staphylococcus ureilyticus]